MYHSVSFYPLPILAIQIGDEKTRLFVYSKFLEIGHLKDPLATTRGPRSPLLRVLAKAHCVLKAESCPTAQQTPKQSPACLTRKAYQYTRLHANAVYWTSFEHKDFRLIQKRIRHSVVGSAPTIQAASTNGCRVSSTRV